MAHMPALSKQLTFSALLAVFTASSIDARTPEETQAPIAVSWNEAGAVILGHKIAVALSNGAVVEGKVLKLNSDSLDLQISKTSDSRIQPKVRIVIPRPSLHTLKLIKPQKKWRIILTSVGAGSAIPLWALSSYSYNEGGWGPPPPLAVAMAAGGTVGYFAGWAVDGHQDVTITIP